MQLDNSILQNKKVKIMRKKRKSRSKKDKGWIKVTPLKSQPDPHNIEQLKQEMLACWPGTSLLDVLKETEYRVEMTSCFKSTASRENLDRKILQKRLLLCLFALATNVGLKRISSGNSDVNHQALRYVYRRFINKENIRTAICGIVNAIFQVRLPEIWGEATTACASDAKHFSSWDQNLMTEWHVRYGGRGIMVYWHIEKKSACIYSQVKRCSSSEVAAMIEGVLRHCTSMEVDKNYVDTHGQSIVGFAFSYLLSFDLLPWLKNIGSQKLSQTMPSQTEVYPNIKRILTKPIRWQLICEQYNQLIKYTTALRLGTADPEIILKRFTRNNIKHPVYKALMELGKAVKTVFFMPLFTV